MCKYLFTILSIRLLNVYKTLNMKKETQKILNKNEIYIEKTFFIRRIGHSFTLLIKYLN